MTNLTPGSPEWCRRVSPSKAAAILGASPWDSQRSMYLKMRGEIPWDEENEAMERGTLCEPAVLAWWRKHHEHAEWREQVSLTVEDWLVATPDAIADTPDGLVCIQAKTTGSQMDEWGEPGTEAVPSHILVQVFLEMAVCHLNDLPVVGAHIPVLGGYRNLFSNYFVQHDQRICEDLMFRMRSWSDSLTADEPPPLDDSVATFNALKRQHPDIDRGTEVEVARYQAAELAHAVADAKVAEARERLARSVVLDQMGRAQHAVCDGRKVARRQARGDAVSFVPVAKPDHYTDQPQEGAA